MFLQLLCTASLRMIEDVMHLQTDYVVILSLVTSLRLVAPLSIAYTLLSYYAGHWIYSQWLGWYALAEVAFYALVYFPRRKLLQKVYRHIHLGLLLSSEIWKRP